MLRNSAGCRKHGGRHRKERLGRMALSGIGLSGTKDGVITKKVFFFHSKEHYYGDLLEDRRILLVSPLSEGFPGISQPCRISRKGTFSKTPSEKRPLFRSRAEPLGSHVISFSGVSFLENFSDWADSPKPHPSHPFSGISECPFS